MENFVILYVDQLVLTRIFSALGAVRMGYQIPDYTAYEETKCFRYPGWRLGWAIGPRDMITSLGCAASAVDGGPGQPVQRAALQVLEAAQADQETRALRQVFARKRKLMVERLNEMGFKFADRSESTFYVWVNIEDLPPPLHNAERLFREALSRKVLTVPGKCFDVNPGQNRAGVSPYAQWMRLSFGPPEENVILGLDRLATLIEEAHHGSL